MKNLSISIASALLLAAGSAGAATLQINPAAATIPVGAGGTTPATLQVAYDNTGSTADSIEFEITFNDADLNLTVTPVAGISCSYAADSGLVTVIGFDAGGATIPSGNLCGLNFTSTAGATNGEVFPIAFQNVLVSDGGGAAVAPVPTNGAITVTALPANPTTITFAPTIVNLANGGGIAGATSAASVVSVTSAGGVDPNGYTCTQPAGFQLTNAVNPAIPANSDPADISVTCTLAAAAFSGTSTCTRTAGGSTDLTLNCPAPAGPVLSSAPASGTALTCDGTPLSVTQTQVTISNTGTANITGASCSTVGAGFSILQQPTGTIAPGASSNVIVSCNVPAEGAPANTGTLNCTTTAPAGGALTFPLSALGSSGAVPTQPATIPSTSLWAKIGLIGLLAALGALMVGFRRHS